MRPGDLVTVALEAEVMVAVNRALALFLGFA
jgi:hypothetical protein